MSLSKGKSTETSSSNWTTPEGKSLLASTTGAISDALTGSKQSGQQSDNYLAQLLAGDGGANPYSEQLARTIRAENDVNTPALLAAQRSQYRNSPMATAQFGTDEALRLNQIGRDKALYEALLPSAESQASRQLQAAQLMRTGVSADQANALALLDLLSTKTGTAKNSQSGLNIGQLVAGIGAGVGSILHG